METQFEMIDLSDVQRKLIQHLKEVASLIERAELPTEVKQIKLTTSQVKDEKLIEQTVAELPSHGNHVYWFKVDKPKEIVDQFSKREKRNDFKLARDNKGIDSTYVYVGSCTQTKLNNRFKQHCGWGHAQTYALHLRKWLNDVELIFTFSYVTFENDIITMYIEDQLHRQMMPLFGKPGANSKIRRS